MLADVYTFSDDNDARVRRQALAVTQSLYTSNYDEALALPSEEAGCAAHPTEPELLRVDETVQRRQRDRLASVNDEAVAAALATLRTVTRDGENVVPAVVDAVKAYATMGEIMGVFEDQFGSYQETISAA